MKTNIMSKKREAESSENLQMSILDFQTEETPLPHNSYEYFNNDSFIAKDLDDEIKQQIRNTRDEKAEWTQEKNKEIRWMWCRKCHNFFMINNCKDFRGHKGICFSCNLKKNRIKS